MIPVTKRTPSKSTENQKLARETLYLASLVLAGWGMPGAADILRSPRTVQEIAEALHLYDPERYAEPDQRLRPRTGRHDLDLLDRATRLDLEG